MPTDDHPSVTLEGLSHTFDGATFLFSGLSYRFDAGQVYALTGPSGSGKSTLLSIIADMQRPAAGIVTAVGVGRTAWVFQNPYGQPHRTALDHVTYPFLTTGCSRAEALVQSTSVMARFGLEKVANTRFADLSGGEAQRLMLARAVASSPGLLLIDEPTAQLDRIAASTVNRVINALGGGRRIVVVASHDQETVAACGKRIDLEDFHPAVTVSEEPASTSVAEEIL